MTPKKLLAWLILGAIWSVPIGVLVYGVVRELPTFVGVIAAALAFVLALQQVFDDD